MAKTKVSRRNKIRNRIRGTVTGTAQRPRLSVFRSNKDIYAQLIDDVSGVTLVSASSREATIAEVKDTKVVKAGLVGKKIAELAKGAGIEQVVFDRGGYLYHGRVKSLADGAREGGLVF
ncbi:MAG: 50S ribosomal protein L18 [Bacteroidia bacterium]|jgi:large subunit ribosomal protein L18